MATYLDVLDSVAKVVGGTVSPNNARFFSGSLAKDGTGVQAPAGDSEFRGCYSLPPDVVEATPVGILEPDRFGAKLGVQGFEENTETLRLWVLVGRADAKNTLRLAVPYRDLVPAAFRAKLTAGRQATGDNTQIAYAFVTGGQMRQIEWAQTVYLGWDFSVEVLRTEIPGYLVG